MMLNLIPLPYKALAIGLVFIGSTAYAYHKGYDASEEVHRVQGLEAAVAYAEAYEREVERGNEISKKYSEAQLKNREIMVRLSARSSSLVNCGNPPTDFIRLHDYSASKTSMSETSSQSTCKAGDVGYDEASRTIIENYSKCYEWKEQLEALIQWHEGM